MSLGSSLKPSSDGGFYVIIYSRMMRRRNLLPAEIMVRDGEKPGALVWGQNSRLRSQQYYDQAGLEAVPTLLGHSLAYPLPAMPVIEQTVLPSELSRRHSTAMDSMMRQVSGMTIAAALSHLADAPRLQETSHLAKANMETPEAAILEGVLLGYDPCCIDVYMATRYDGRRSAGGYGDISPRIDYQAWPNVHILCDSHELEIAAQYPRAPQPADEWWT